MYYTEIRKAVGPHTEVAGTSDLTFLFISTEGMVVSLICLDLHENLDKDPRQLESY